MPKRNRGNPLITMRLPAADKKRLEAAAQQSGCTMSDFVRMAIDAALAEVDLPMETPDEIPGQIKIGDEE